MVSNKDCAAFISDLIKKTATAKNPAEFTDALKGFDTIKSQGGFIYGNTIRKFYGHEGSTVHGMIGSGDAQVELGYPYPMNIQNQRVAAQIAETQARILAFEALHEVIHLAGKYHFTDYDFANTIAAMKGEAVPTFKNSIDASKYWHAELQGACKPR